MTVLPFVRRSDPPQRRRASDCGATAAATGSFDCPTGGKGGFFGSYLLHRLVSESGKVVAAGVFTGELVDSRGSRIGVGSRQTRAVAQVHISGSTVVAQLDACEVNLFGFLVAMDAVNLDVHGCLGSAEDARQLVDGAGPADVLPVPAKDLLRKIVTGQNAASRWRGAE